MEIEQAVEKENKDDIERILRIYECDENFSVDAIQCQPGSREGDNYMSVVKRIIVRGRFSNDKAAYHRNLIIKRQIPSLTRRQLFRCDKAFNNEISVYCHVVPILKQFSNNRIPFANCLYAGSDAQGEIIALDDLQQFGYRMANRLKGLDYSHCKVVMQELGILHGISMAMKHARPDEFDRAREAIQEIIYCPEAAEFYTHSLESSLREALSSLRHSNCNGDLDTVIACMERKLTGQMYTLMTKVICDTDEPWRVLCHSDLWINNLMFSYGSSNRVNGVKLIDLQTVRCTSAVIDILHFVYTSTEYELRQRHLDHLLADYTESLLVTIQRYLGANVQLPAFQAAVSELEAVRMEFNRKSFYGLGICMWLLPAVTFHPDRIPDLDAITLDDFTTSTQEENMAQMQTPEYHKRMRETALEFFHLGMFNDIT